LKGQARQISQIALKLGVEGNRADVFALKAARASAALAGRDAVTEEDLVAAVQLVLVPRATTLPLPEHETKQTESSPPDDAAENGKSDLDVLDGESMAGSIEDLIIQAIDARVPNDSQPTRNRRIGRLVRGRSGITQRAVVMCAA
jgi:magnesium chelatase subunit D